ncbi:hypothetical protein BH23GEM7_BH23GEM7_26000 [soil metagenome]
MRGWGSNEEKGRARIPGRGCGRTRLDVPGTYLFDLAGKHGAPEIGGSPVDIYAIALYSIFAAVAVVALWALSRAWGE